MMTIRPLTATDWRGRQYEVEIARVAFLGGYVAWIDDDPWNEGEPFPSRREAERTLRHHFGSLK
jgi:hypothetical protein